MYLNADVKCTVSADAKNSDTLQSLNAEILWK